MLGKDSGGAGQLQERYPNLVIWHCCNHRLELAVGDTTEEVTSSNNFRAFFDKLYSLYHASPKNQRELEDCCKTLAVQCLSIGGVLNVRWVASSLRTVKAVLTQFTALHAHFVDASSDSSRDKKERAMHAGTFLDLDLLNKFTSESVIKVI